MLVTVEAEVDVNGEIELLEPLKVKKRTRAIVTLLEEPNGQTAEKGNGKALLQVLKDNPLPESSRRTAQEIDDWIEELRSSWD